MIEAWVRPHMDRFLIAPFVRLFRLQNPMIMTLLALILGVAVIPAVTHHNIELAILLMFLSGVCDVFDGVIAREHDMVSDIGSFFDVLFDRVVESAIIIAIFLVDPSHRGFDCLLMMSSVLICITTFLLMGALDNLKQTHKSFYYSPGLIERFEAFVFFGLMLWYPQWFGVLAKVFVTLVLYTVVQHVKRFRLCKTTITKQ